ncbi:RagB/SusD family nutrient uptake outer membrane protein [Empedobacter tilapiae]|uniref:RagB/SusD family nutrient uptake outer membrane protein n=1 Tax=Empedobacter tilapiae TaxID=2491114 RepID=UPI0028D30FD6|nr:RagB/SusD family nutrient uptake outer membrane protein [Empedobacter tilapiae]
MKKIIILLAAVSTTLLSTGCMDDYLNEPNNSDSGNLSPEDAYKSYDGTKAVMAGLLRLQRWQWMDDDFARSTDVGGLYAMEFRRAVKGDDVIIYSSWYLADYQNNDANREVTSNKTVFSWRFPYTMIAKLNQFIKGVETSPRLSDNEKKEFLSQGRALRGFYYYQLALEFNHALKKDPNALAAPIYTEVSTEGKPMSKLVDLYGQITNDLEFAVENGTDTRVDNSWINKRVSAGILSNVYLSMEEWSKAESMAKIAYNQNVKSALNTVVTYKPIGFNDKSDKEWLWSIPQRTDQSNYYYLAPHAFMDPINPAYNNGYINANFVKKFANNDRRKEAFMLKSASLPETDPRYYVSKKFTFAFSSDAAIFRLPEFVLVAAEAAFHQGKIVEANQILNDFKSTRYTDYVNENLSGDALFEEILLERRKELYAENGVEWFDAKRLQRGITRTGNHAQSLTMAPNDKKFIMKIPQIEIDNNPFIDASINNGR